MRPIYNKSLDLDKVIVILCERLMQIARDLYANDAFGVDLANTVYALDSSTTEVSYFLAHESISKHEYAKY